MWFKELTWYKRIGTKMSVLTSLLVIIFISAYTYFSIKSQREYLTEEVIRSVNLLSDTIKLSARKDMLLYSPSRLHQLVDTFGTQPALEKVRIFNYVGEIIYSSDKSEMGMLVDKRAEQCYACHSAEKPLEKLGTPERTRIFNSGSYRVLGMINPVYNEPDCYNASCHVHPPDQKVLGVLDIDVSLKPMDEQIRSAEAKLLATGISSVIALAILIKILMNHFLHQPLRKIITGTHRVAQGDLDFQIPIRSKDEIGIFAASFNQMTQDLKRAKISLTEWGNRLEQMVAERTRDLENAQQQLIRSEKLASLGKLSAGVAHEINNPLTGILTFSQLLMDQFPPESQEHQDLKVIVQETIRCRGIVRGLLEFARQSAPEKRTVNIEELLDEVLYMVENQESFQNIKLEQDIDANIPQLMADKDQLKQVLFNILMNASEAMSGAGTLQISAEWRPDRSQVVLHFRDSGPGIDPEHLNKLFDPFFTTKEMGTGLGLAISYGIIKAHRGNIEIESTLGQGTHVIVTLPAEAPVQAENRNAGARFGAP
ncbi:sensor histidine kinase [Desulfoferrobacter suflitae]|uniref:sensor histidine kinase n=1 Tax=Desulfoferrobacter suflitae TaxID=2865782 RepID=UPI002164C94E|nr:ATP-binding protein [Desulfoferrobacter suflitae]MCK8602024.1 ATP-binding protein [Desulfoferrobacter suflitae]